MKKITNKWQILFRLGRDYRTMERGWKELQFGVMNIMSFPPDGMMLQKCHYKGFLIKFYIWFPIDF